MTQSDIINNNFSKVFECIKCSNAYTTGEVLSEEKLFKQISERRHSTFDLSKFTIVGSPTITDDGVVSGFDSANANNIQIPTAIISQIATANTWKVKISGTVQESGYIYNNIRPDNVVRYDLIQINRFANGFLFVCCLDENGTTKSKNIDIIFPNTYNGKAYKATLEFTGTKYIATVQFEDGEVLTNSLDSTYKIKFYNYGDKFELGYKCINGSIDLKNFSITVDGKEVFSGNKTGIDVINDIEIPYTLSKTGSKIVDVAYRDRVIDLYEQEGQAGYYTIDEDNKNFTLPMGEIYGMIGGSSSTGGSGLEICDIGMALYVDETKGLRRYLNGQIVDINTNTQAFLNRLKQITTLHPSLLCTEEEWQTAKTMSAFGQVGKFVFNYSGGDIISVRLPRVVNVQGLFDLQNLGMTVEAGLPNHTHALTLHGRAGNNARINRESSWCYDDWVGSNSTATTTQVLNNSVYGKSNTVQQEAIQYPYFIQIATGQETENNIVNEIELNTPSFFGDSKYVPTAVNNLSWLKSEGQNNPKGTYPSFYDWILENVNKGTKNFKGKKLYQFKGNTTETEGYTPSCSTRNPVVGTWFYGYAPVQPMGYVTQVNSDSSIVIHDNKVNRDYTLVYKQEIITLPNLLKDYDFYIDTDDETFRLPLLNGSENLLSDRYIFNIISSSITTTQQTYTAPANGWVYIKGYQITGGSIYANIKTPLEVETSVSGAGAAVNSSFKRFVKRGDTLVVWSDGASFNNVNSYFQYAQGNGTLYYYVGETAQNAKLIDAGRIGEILPTKTDMQQATKASMPSGRYIDLTLGASGSTYTAPADGWLQCACTGTIGSTFFELVHPVISCCASFNGGWGRASMPVTKGMVITVYYGGNNFTKTIFRFTYAEGSK